MNRVPFDYKFTEQYFSLASSLPPLPPIEGVHETLDILSRKFVLGIVSGRPRAGFGHAMMGAGLDFSKFSFILSQDDTGRSKDEHGYFDPALRELAKLGIRKEEVLFVGDSVFDFEASKNAGIHFVGVLTGPATRGDLEVMELPRFIESNGFGKP